MIEQHEDLHAIDLWSYLLPLQMPVQLMVGLLQQVVLYARQFSHYHVTGVQVLGPGKRLGCCRIHISLQ